MYPVPEKNKESIKKFFNIGQKPTNIEVSRMKHLII